MPQAIEPSSFTLLPDLSGFVFVGEEKSGLRSQLWFQPYQTGEPFRVTNDFDQYTTVSVSSDGRSLATVQSRSEPTIYVGDAPAILTDNVHWQLKPITSDRISGSCFLGLLAENFSNQTAVVSLTADGTSRSRLLETNDTFTDPRSCGSIITLVKSVLFAKFQGEGQNVLLKFVIKSLADESEREIPAPSESHSLGWTPDGRALTFLKGSDSSVDLWMIPVSGGKPARIMHFDDEPSWISAYDWSRDGEKIAVTRARDNASVVVLFHRTPLTVAALLQSVPQDIRG